MNSNTKFLYILVSDNFEWEDIKVYINIDEAIKVSIEYPESRIEIFTKNEDNSFTPMYHYYKNGVYYYV